MLYEGVEKGLVSLCVTAESIQCVRIERVVCVTVTAFQPGNCGLPLGPPLSQDDNLFAHTHLPF